jgi:hypothetical protein
MAKRNYGKFAVLIRHPYFIDCYARSKPDPDYYTGNIDGWTVHRDDPPKFIGRFETMGAANAHIEMLKEKTGNPVRYSHKYRFSVIEERLVLNWFLAEPEDEREKMPVGSVAQI